ncbi:hypothetical protein EDD15DRAFT_2362721 [Pisolithus albus]|nr:hypothetical protein EDD15DRAFT_2362721 [Pisolithus albus]
MSFRCEHCGARNTEVRSTGTIKGASDLHRADLGRQIVRSEAYTVEIPDIELELPPVHGQLTIVGDSLRDITADLSSDPLVRRILEAAAHTRIQHINDGTKDVLGDEEEVEDGVDEAGQVSSATEKSKEDPIKKTIKIPRETASSNFSEAYRTLVGIRDREGTSEEMAEGDGAGASDTNEELHKFMGVCSRRAGPASQGYVDYVDKLRALRIPRQRSSYPERYTWSGTPKGFIILIFEDERTRSAEKPFSLISDDPPAHSYSYVHDRDPNMEVVTFERKWQPNEEPGLNDMKGENCIFENQIEVKTFEEVTS